MKRFPQLIIFFAATLFAVSAFGQEPQDAQNPQSSRSVSRMDYRHELGLTQGQIRQMRLIRQEARVKRQASRARLSEASRNLDQTIYADTVDEALFAQRLREMQEAQAEIARLNFESELAIRKILTPEQLVRFREMRKKFHDRRERRQRRKRDRDTRPGNERQHGQRPVDHRPGGGVHQSRVESN